MIAYWYHTLLCAYKEIFASRWGKVLRLAVRHLYLTIQIIDIQARATGMKCFKYSPSLRFLRIRFIVFKEENGRHAWAKVLVADITVLITQGKE